MSAALAQFIETEVGEGKAKGEAKEIIAVKVKVEGEAEAIFENAPGNRSRTLFIPGSKDVSTSPVSSLSSSFSSSSSTLSLIVVEVVNFHYIPCHR